MSAGQRLGEIIETSTVGFTAQSHDLHRLPPLGSLVAVGQAGGGEVLAVVAYGETAGIDSGRRAVRRGTDQTVDGDIYREHPELVHVLRTIFRARTVGYADEHGLHQVLPPMPPPLHYSVRPCPPATVRAFTGGLHYLRTLLAADGEVGPEHLLAAHIRAVAAVRGDEPEWLEAAAHEVARLFQGEYDRLLTVLLAIDPHQLPVASRQSPVTSGQ